MITEDGNQKVEFNFKNKNGDTLSKPIIALSEVHLAESGSPATDFSGLISPTDKRKINALDTTFLKLTDVINDLTTGGVTKGLSAEQGKILKGLIDAIKRTHIN